jgi:hypothetical protein
LGAVRRKNSEAKVLGLSATPVVNNLTEGKSLLEMITGKNYEDLNTNATISNAVTLYNKFTILSIREMPEYKLVEDRKFVDVYAEIPKSILVLS